MVKNEFAFFIPQKQLSKKFAKNILEAVEKGEQRRLFFAGVKKSLRVLAVFLATFSLFLIIKELATVGFWQFLPDVFVFSTIDGLRILFFLLPWGAVALFFLSFSSFWLLF